MRTVKRTTWKIKHEVVTVVQGRSYAAANAGVIDGFDNSDAETVHARERIGHLAISGGDCLQAINKREEKNE